MTVARLFARTMASAGLVLAPLPAMAAAPLDRGDVVATGAAADAIGVATREADGTIALHLRAEGPDGAIGDRLLRYPPGDKDYAMIARHIGPIPRSGSVPVRPFDR